MHLPNQRRLAQISGSSPFRFAISLLRFYLNKANPTFCLSAPLPDLCEASSARRREPEGFSETAAWKGVGRGWQQLHGSFEDLGFSVEWHDFETARDLDWSGSFHPSGVEICLNL